MQDELYSRTSFAVSMDRLSEISRNQRYGPVPIMRSFSSDSFSRRRVSFLPRPKVLLRISRMAMLPSSCTEV